MILKQKKNLVIIQKNLAKTFTNEQKRDVKHSHTKKKKHGNPQNLMLKKKTHMHINIYL